MCFIDVLLFTSSTTFGTETPSDTPGINFVTFALINVSSELPLDVEQSVYECCYDLLRYNHEQVVVEESENMTLVASKPVCESSGDYGLGSHSISIFRVP